MSAPSSHPPWEADFLCRQSVFNPLRLAGDELALQEQWPDIDALNLLGRRHGVRNAAGEELRFVLSGPKKRRRRRTSEIKPLSYEDVVHGRAEVPTRHASWHDLFNALVWCTYPHVKAALNLRQIAAKESSSDPAVRAGRQRNLEQNRLTMFDEGGMVIVTTAPRAQQWSAWLDVPRRHDQCLGESPFVDERFFLIGHAIMESIQGGDWAVTAMAQLLIAEEEFFTWPVARQAAWVDQHMAMALREKIMARERAFGSFPISLLREIPAGALLP